MDLHRVSYKANAQISEKYRFVSRNSAEYFVIKDDLRANLSEKKNYISVLIEYISTKL